MKFSNGKSAFALGKGFVGVILLFCAAAALAQPSSRASGQAPQTPQWSQGPAVSAPQEAPQSSAPRSGAPQSADHKISRQEADELFRSVDEIVQFASRDTSLPVKHPVKRRLISRDEVVAYIQKHMAEDEDTQRLRRSELVLKKFGLLPRDFDLGKLLIALLREQVAGYYDPQTQTVNLLDWVDLDQQSPVMAHELTHALQDQSFGLEKWMKAGDADLATRKNEPTPADIENDEVQTARQAIVEGQAMAVLVDYTLAPAGKSLMDSPEMAETFAQSMLAGTADSVQFQNAPLFMKAALTFPYQYGLSFVTDVLIKRGKKSYADEFTEPPRSSRQIMEPQTYLSGERIDPMPLPDFAAIFNHYDRFDVGAMGEFDVSVLVEQFAGPERSHDLYPAWRGGYYYAVRPKGHSEAPLGLMYASRWSTPAMAAQFARVYADSLPKRYQGSQEVQASAAKPVDAKNDWPDNANSLTGRHTWQTAEGPVVVEVRGDTVLVSESLDDATTNALAKAVFAAKTSDQANVH